jgi:zinc transport system substrate-binding protein
VIADALGKEDPQNSAFYDANAKVFIRRITVVLGELTQQLGVFKDLSLIVFHDAFHNLVQRFAIAVVGAIYD